MSRYTGPRRKILRALGIDLPGLSRRTIEGNPNPPGQHGYQKANRKKSEFGLQVMERLAFLPQGADAAPFPLDVHRIVEYYATRI